MQYEGISFTPLSPSLPLCHLVIQTELACHLHHCCHSHCFASTITFAAASPISCATDCNDFECTILPYSQFCRSQLALQLFYTIHTVNDKMREALISVKSPVFPGKLLYLRCWNLGSKLLYWFSCVFLWLTSQSLLS